MRRRRFLSGCATAAAGVLAGCGGGGGTRVEMTDGLRFSPTDLTVATGSTVTWTTVGAIPHTVTAYQDGIPDDAVYFASGGFGSESAARDDLSAGLIDKGDRFRHTVDVPGTYEYYCIPHEGSGMTGRLTVE